MARESSFFSWFWAIERDTAILIPMSPMREIMSISENRTEKMPNCSGPNCLEKIIIARAATPVAPTLPTVIRTADLRPFELEYFLAKENMCLLSHTPSETAK